MREVNFSFNRLTGNFLRWTGLFAVILTTAFAGCKVGLGDSVDTEAPSVGILYPDPKSNAIIRDEFVLYGSCQDDKQITAVKVTLTNIDSGETVLSDAPAVVDSDQKHWRINLNSYSEENKYNGWQFADGKYTVTVRAYDGSHDSSSDEKSSASSSFEIDNTAPVFVIKNPGVLKSENTSPSAYGSIFTVEGTISELHSVSSMEVTVYNEAGECVSEGSYNGEELKAFVEENIEIAGGTSVIIAQSGAADGRYGKIYGNASGTQRYTCSIKLTDNSKKYVTPPETSDNRTAEEAALDESGNSTYNVYLYDDVYDSLLSQKNEGSKKLSAGDLKNIINGTFGDEEAKNILLGAEKNTGYAEPENASKRLYFSLNPEANPTYNVNGFEYSFDKTDSLQQASAGNAVSITVSQGLDQTQIDLDGSEKSGSTVKVWMKEYSDRPLDEGNVKEELTGTLAPKVKAQEDDASVGFVEYMKATEESPVTEFEGWKLIFDYGQNNSGESSVSTKTFSVTLPAGSIALNKYYLLAVTGRDIDNVEFSQNTIYGFEGNEAGVPPTLSIEDVYADDAKTVKNLKPSSDFEFKGKAVLNSSSLYTSEFMVKLTVTDQDSDKVIDTVTQTVTRSALDKGWTETAALKFSDKENWTFKPDLLGNESIKVEAEAGKSYLYTLEVWGKASSGHESSSTLNLQIDSKNPAVEITSITPTVEEYNETKGPFVNGKIYVKGTVEETNLENVEIEVLVGGEVKKQESLGKKYSINYEIDTTTLSAGELEVKLIAVDKVGNKNDVSSAVLDDYKGLKIDQRTDKPLIKLNNASAGVGKDDINVANNLFGTVSNNNISVSVSDDDLVKSVTMKVYSGEKNIDTTTKPDIGKSTCSYSFPLPKTEGVYKIQIIVEDDVLSTELSDRIPMVSTEEFYVAVSAGAPTINLNTVKTYLTATPTFSGTVSSEQATVSARFKKVSIGGNDLDDDGLSAQNGKIAPANKEPDGTAWSVSLNENAFLDNGKYTILFTAANKYGESNSLEAEFTVDNVPPEVKITEYNSIKNENGFTEPQKFYLNPTNIKTIKGTCADNESGSGIDSVYYHIGAITGKETPSTENGWILANLTKTESETGWTISLTDLNVTEGENYPVHIKATDKAGNISGDNSAITLYIDSTPPATTLKGTALFDSTGTSVQTLNSDGSAYYAKESFSLGGIITEENLDSIKINGNTVTPAGNEWKYEPTIEKDGTYTYKAVLTDKAGNQSEYSIIVTYDTASPAVSVTSPAAGDNIKDGKITISGNASDIGSGVKKISYTITKVSESGTPETKTGEKEISESGEWKFENIGIPGEGKYSLTVEAQDVLGNSGAAPSVEFYYDKSAPSLNANISDATLFTHEKDGKLYSVYSSATFNIKAEASDAVSGVSSVIANSTTTLQKDADDSYTGTVVASLNADGTTSISIVASDKYGNTATQTIENIMVDVLPPSLAVSSYPGNATKDEFTLSGTVSDNLGVESVVITDSLDSSKSYTAVVSNGTWSVTVTLKPSSTAEGENGTKDGSHTYTVTAKDKVGNTSTATCRVTTDTTAPYWYTGNTEAKEPYISTKASSEKITVGDAEYSLYNSTSLTVAAKAKDETTNVEKLLYNLNDEKDASSIVWKSADNGNITVDNLVQGLNKLKIKAADEAGNETSEVAISFFVDSLAPAEPVLKSIDSDSDENSMADFVAQNKQKLVNGKEDVTFTLEVADDTSNGENSYSGIASVELTKIGNKTLSKAISGTFVSQKNGKQVYSITVPASELASGSANVTVKDKAGNATTLGMFNFLLDNKAPVVSLASPAGDVNKTISLSGSATDNQEIDEATLKLEYSTDKTEWTELSSGNAGSEYKAVISDSVISVTGFDTTKFADKTTVYVRAVISDKAKNEGKSEEVALSIKQDSDRPVIKIDNLVKLGDRTFILKYGTNAQITGTLSDDDSTTSTVVEKENFVISESPYTGSESVENLATFNESTGDFTFQPKDTEDGEKTLYFYMKDNGGNEFYTTASTGTDSSGNTTYLQNPKLYLKTVQLEDDLAVSAFTYKSDSTSPQVGNVEGKVSDSLTEYENDYSGISVSFVAGGDNRYLKLKVTASDANGINGILLDITDSSGNTLFKRATASEIAEIAIDSSTNESDGNFTLSGSKVTSAAKYYVDSNDSKTESEDKTTYTWELGSAFDLKNVATGSLTITAKLYDNSGLPGNGSYTFMVDNSGPEVKMTSPSSSAIVSGSSISVTGITEERGSSSVNSIQWYIPKSIEKDLSSEALNSCDWKGEMSKTSTEKAWTFVFNGTDNALFSEYTKDSTYATPDNDGVYELPIFFKATDALGNYTICKDYSIRYNPDADRPVTQITYPDSSILKPEGYAVLGGTIRITGTVEIPSGDSVAYNAYLQISDDNGNFDNYDKTTAENTYNFKVIDADGLESEWQTSQGSTAKLNFSNDSDADNTKRDAWWGIPATIYSSKTSWYIKINEDGLMNKIGVTNNVKIRVCGVGENGKVGLWSDAYSIHIDSQVPRYSVSPLLYQYSTSTELSSGDSFHGATPTSSQAYSSGIYLKGQWYLWTRVTDETAVKVNGISRGSTPLTCGTDYFVWPSTADNSNKNAAGSDEKDPTDDKRYIADVYIKIDPTSSLIQNYTITAEDSDANGSNSSTATFEVYADNIAPSFLLNSSSKPILTDGNDSEISMTKLRNSDHVVTFGSTATDTGSGFERIAFYFVRNVDGQKTVELPIPSNNGSAWENSSSAAYVGEITSSGDLQTDKDLTDPIDANYSDNALYGVTLSGTVASSEDTTTFTAISDISGYKFIRKGGIIKISGIYYTILKVSGNTITVDGAISENATKAFAAASLIVDNTSGEANDQWSSGFVIKNDDGDGIIESVKKSGSTWTWDASVYLDELEDGPVTLVTMAFDKAGNVRTLETPVMIANNTPRLAKVYLATDLNGDGKFSDNELGTSIMSDTNENQKFYSALTNGTTGRVQEVVTIESSSGSKNTGITMRNDLGLSFEFVGGSGFEGYGSGNGQLCYKLAVGGSALTTATAGTDGNLVEANAVSYDNTLGSTTAGIISSKLAGFKIPTSKFTPGSYNEWASANVSDGNDNNEINYIGVTLWDSTKGTTPGTGDTTDSEGNITKFGSQWTVVNIPLYIDLVDDQFPVPLISDPTAETSSGHVDLSSTLPSSNFAGSGEFDTDTKISGTVVFTGTVTDEKRVESIYLTTSRSFSSTSVSSKKIATYDTKSGDFTLTQPATGLTFAITSNEFSTEGGHTVGWSLTVDTSKVEGIAAGDVKFTVAASDGTNVKDVGYQVDVVPYITGIERATSSKSNKEMNRSTYGEYPVAVGDTLKVSGWNFGTSPTVEVGSTTFTPEADGTSFKIDAPKNSGELTVTVKKMVSLNDKNNNASKSNLDSDGKFDNRYIRVWDVGHYFSQSSSGNIPTLIADKKGNLFSSWTMMGSGTVQLQRNLSSGTIGYSQKPSYAGYDQPDKITAFAVDNSKDNGDLSVLFLPANVGNGGKVTNIGYANGKNIGGAWGQGISNSLDNISVSMGQDKTVTITGNPTHAIDGTTNVAGFQIASYAMGREVSVFDAPRTARYGNKLHYTYYDSVNKALRYSYIDMDNYSLNTTSNAYRYNVDGWVLIDGTSTGIDRLHEKVVNQYGTVVTGTDIFSTNSDSIDKDGKTGDKDFSTLVATVNPSNDSSEIQTANVTMTRQTAMEKAYSTNGISIALMYTDGSGNFKYDLHDLSSEPTYSNGAYTFTWDTSVSGETPTGYSRYTVAVYFGAKNIVSSGSSSSSAGKYQSLALTSNGKPVIVYYDAEHEQLKIAYCSASSNGATASNWTRQTIPGVSGGTYVQAKIDGDDCLHIMYRNSLGELCYLNSTYNPDNNPEKNGYKFGSPMTIDSSGTYGTLSVMKTDSGYVPCVSWLNSEGTANGVKYALLRSVDTGNGNTESLWDVQIVPAVVDKGNQNHYVSGGELVYVEGKSGSWNATEDGVSMGDCDSVVGFNTGRMDVVFLKSEK